MKLIYQKIAALIVGCLLIVGCEKHETNTQGYVDADYTYISSNYSGDLTELFVARGNPVKKGQLLFTLDAQPEKAQLQNAQAHVDEAMAQIQKQQIDFDYQTKLLGRYQQLVKNTGVSREEFEKIQNNYKNSQASLKSQQANLQASLAELEQAKWKSSSKLIKAPLSGYVYDTYYTVGELVQENRPVLALVAPENLKVIFYVSETILNKLSLNQHVQVTCDGCAKTITAEISFISSETEYTPPNIYSEQTRTKFIYRIEAKSNQTEFRNLHPGQPVSIVLR